MQVRQRFGIYMLDLKNKTVCIQGVSSSNEEFMWEGGVDLSEKGISETKPEFKKKK